MFAAYGLLRTLLLSLLASETEKVRQEACHVLATIATRPNFETVIDLDTLRAVSHLMARDAAVRASAVEVIRGVTVNTPPGIKYAAQSVPSCRVCGWNGRAAADAGSQAAVQRVRGAQPVQPAAAVEAQWWQHPDLPAQVRGLSSARVGPSDRGWAASLVRNVLDALENIVSWGRSAPVRRCPPCWVRHGS
jgi:hypothetical protein